MFSNILVPLDGSELSEKLLPVVQELAHSANATIHLISVVSRYPEVEASRGAGDLSIGSVESDREMARRLVERQITRSEEYLKRLAAQMGSVGLEVKTAIQEGAAGEQIIEYAKDNSIDLIAMSSHGHSGLRRLLLGSVTDRVVRSGEVPVLVLPAS